MGVRMAAGAAGRHDGTAVVVATERPVPRGQRLRSHPRSRWDTAAGAAHRICPQGCWWPWFLKAPRGPGPPRREAKGLVDKPTWGGLRRRMGPVGLLVAIVSVQALAISGLSALIPAYLHRAGAGDFLIGLSFTAWAVTRGAFGLVAGRVYGRVGARRLLTVALGLFAATTLGYALDHAPPVLVALRLAQGVAAGFFWTPLLAATAEACPPEGRLRALSYVSMAYAATGLVSNVVAGAIAAGLSPGAFFWMECAVLACAGLPLARTLPAGTGTGSRRAELAHLEAAAAADEPARLGPRQRLQAVLAALAGLPVVVTAVAAPVLLVRAGAGYRLVGMVAAGMVLANITAQAPAHHLAARCGEGRLLATLGALTALLLIALSFAHSTVSIAAVVIPLSGTLALLTLTWLSWAQGGVATNALGALTGLMRGVADLSAVFAYTAFGLIASHLHPALWTLAAVAATTGVAAWALANSPTRPAARPHSAAGHLTRRAARSADTAERVTRAAP